MTANVKLGLITVLVLALIGFAKWGYDSIYQAGANSVHAELAQEFKDREKALNERLAKALADNEEEKATASRMQETLRNTQAANRKLRDEINDATFECTSIGGDFMELWNKTISEPAKLN